MNFADKIKAFEHKALLAANRSVSNAVEDLFTSVVVLSPSPSNKGKYATGLLANQYYPEVGGNFSSSLSMSTNPNGTDSLSRIKKTMAGNHWLGKDCIITLTNNTPEAYHAEVIGWPKGEGSNGWVWRGSQPYKMVATSVNNWKGKYM